ncbi:MAG: hypothetical protein LBL08_03625 [Candidatus Nomurabacteria bacterium]|jgi:hypothetical protein|nr:hypothetical protein [Candidatus Nomurabacteria bacterium]
MSSNEFNANNPEKPPEAIMTEQEPVAPEQETSAPPPIEIAGKTLDTLGIERPTFDEPVNTDTINYKLERAINTYGRDIENTRPHDWRYATKRRNDRPRNYADDFREARRSGDKDTVKKMLDKEINGRGRDEAYFEAWHKSGREIYKPLAEKLAELEERDEAVGRWEKDHPEEASELREALNEFVAQEEALTVEASDRIVNLARGLEGDYTNFSGGNDSKFNRRVTVVSMASALKRRIEGAIEALEPIEGALSKEQREIYDGILRDVDRILSEGTKDKYDGSNKYQLNNHGPEAVPDSYKLALNAREAYLNAAYDRARENN